MELNGFSVPDKDTGQLSALKLSQGSWSQFVGVVPGTVKIAPKWRFPSVVRNGH